MARGVTKRTKVHVTENVKVPPTRCVRRYVASEEGSSARVALVSLLRYLGKNPHLGARRVFIAMLPA